MSDLLNPGSESPKPAIDLTNYVPKEEVEKSQAASKAEQEKLRSDLEQAKMSLLDPEYIAYLESKKAHDEHPPTETPGEADLDNMTPRQLLTLAIKQATEAVETRSDKRLRRIEATLSDTLGLLELRDVEARYKDFPEYKEDVIKLLSDPKSRNLTMDQAYKQAKGDRAIKTDAEKAAAEPAAKKPSPSEKPTGAVPKEGFVQKEFKTDEAAADDAWDQIVGAGKDTV